VPLKRQLPVAAFALLVLAGASACGHTAPQAAVTAAPSDDKALCAGVTSVSQTAAEALAPVAAALAGRPLSAVEVAKATDDLKATFTTMHLGVAGAAEKAGDPDLKAKISAYQYAVEQAIVAVEGADGQTDRLVAAIELPALRDAKQGVVDACEAS
jgi:hypothetical protein